MSLARLKNMIIIWRKLLARLLRVSRQREPSSGLTTFLSNLKKKKQKNLNLKNLLGVFVLGSEFQLKGIING